MISVTWEKQDPSKLLSHRGRIVPMNFKLTEVTHAMLLKGTAETRTARLMLFLFALFLPS